MNKKKRKKRKEKLRYNYIDPVYIRYTFGLISFGIGFFYQVVIKYVTDQNSKPEVQCHFYSIRFAFWNEYVNFFVVNNS